MKTVPCLKTEPIKLAEYRAEFPADATSSGSESSSVWERFRDTEAYGEVLQALLHTQLGLCGYCEQRLTSEKGEILILDRQIEHVLPKSEDAGRTLDWRNMMLCCAGGTDRYAKDESRRYAGEKNVSCGQKKGEETIDALCDPRGFPWELRMVNIGIDGELFVDEDACKQAGINVDTFNHVINNVLNLNCERLRVAREKVVSLVKAEFVWLAEELLKRTRLNVSEKAAFADLMVRGRLAPDEFGHLCAFWTAERQYLEPWSQKWIEKNAARLGFE